MSKGLAQAAVHVKDNKVSGYVGDPTQVSRDRDPATHAELLRKRILGTRVDEQCTDIDRGHTHRPIRDVGSGVW